MLDIIARCFLHFSHPEFIIPFIIIGYIWVDHKIFSQALCVFLTSIILNYALKVSFQVPLFTHLGEGFAFPSGHTQSTTVFYGWLALRSYNRKFQTTIILLLIGIGVSLVQSNYHNFYDVFGGWIVAILLLLSCFGIYIKKSKFFIPFLIFFVIFLMIYINLIYSIPRHVWGCFYILISFIGAEKIFQSRLINGKLRNGNFILILYITLCFIIGNISKNIDQNFLLYLREMPLIMGGYLLPLFNFLLSKYRFSKT